MHINILAVGHKMPEWINSGFGYFQQRLPRNWNVELSEIAPVKRSKSFSIKQAKQREGQRILNSLPASCLVVALDIHGQMLSTEKLSEQLQGWQMTGRDICFLIGGADGLDKVCLDRADFRWSFSPLVFPHGMARLILIEQLYRAWSITNHHPYHSGH